MIDALRGDNALYDRFLRREELAPAFLDQYGRFRRYSSRDGDPFDPAVSRLLVERGFSPAWPGGAPFAVSLSHDVDFVDIPLPTRAAAAARAIRHGEGRRAGRLALGAVSRRWNSLRDFAGIMDLEAAYGARSTFFLLALEPGERDFAYRIEDLRDDLAEIDRRGWEVGLHGGHEAWINADALRREKDRIERALGKTVTGYRSHFLRFRVPATWELLARAGFAWDASLGWPDCPGFRSGVCHPYRPYDPASERAIDIVEVPLVLMDRQLDAYLHFDAARARDLIALLIDAVAACRGVLSVLWHPADLADPAGRALYERILATCRERGAWLVPVGEIAGAESATISENSIA